MNSRFAKSRATVKFSRVRVFALWPFVPPFVEALVMSTGVDTNVNLKDLVVSSTLFGPKEVKQITDAIAADFSNYRQLRDAVQELESAQSTTPAAPRSWGCVISCWAGTAWPTRCYGRLTAGHLAQFYLGRTCSARGHYEEAVKAFHDAAKAGYDRDACALAVASAQRSLGNATAALATLDQLSGAVEQTAEYLYQRGATVAALGGNPSEVVALYERAVEADGRHPGAYLVWPWKTIAAAMTKPRLSCINARPRSSRPTSARS